MRGRADADAVVAKGNAKKRDLDDAPQVGLGAGNPDAKRRHTASGQGARDGDGAGVLNSSSSHSSRQDVKSYGSSKPTNNSRLDTLLFSSRPSSSQPALQWQHSLRPPNSTASAARAPGASGPSAALGAPRALLGAKPGLAGGAFSGVGRPTRNQNPGPDGPPTSSSTSSDASSIPAGLGENLAATASKHLPKTSFQSLRYGHKPADHATAAKGSPQNQDRTDLGAKSDNTRGVAAGPQRRASRTRGTRRHPYASSSRDDGSYIEEDDGVTGEDGDETAIPFPNTRQGSARPRGRSSGDSLSKDDPDGDLHGERQAKLFSYGMTPSGKGYHVFSSKSPSLATFALCLANVILDENEKVHFAMFALFPDGYRPQRVSGLKSFHFPCPVRTCSKQFDKINNLDQHFKVNYPFLLF